MEGEVCVYVGEFGGWTDTQRRRKIEAQKQIEIWKRQICVLAKKGLNEQTSKRGR